MLEDVGESAKAVRLGAAKDVYRHSTCLSSFTRAGEEKGVKLQTVAGG